MAHRFCLDNKFYLPDHLLYLFDTLLENTWQSPFLTLNKDEPTETTIHWPREQIQFLLPKHGVFFFCRSLHGRFIYFTISTGERKVVALILSTCPIMQMFPEPYSQILDTVGTKSKTTQGKLLHFLCVCLPPRAPPLAGSNSWGLPGAAQPFSAGHWQNQYAHSREDKKGPGLSAGTDHLRWHPCVRRKGRRKWLVPGHS